MVIDARFAVHYVHRLRFTRDGFDARNTALAEVIREGGNVPAPTLAFVDSGLSETWPELPIQIKAYAERHADVMRLAGPVQFVAGGEQCKNDAQGMLAILRTIDEARLCRQSYVIVIGGGAVLDTVGFAAAIAHRGVRLIRFPTTTLAQGDSGLGVKNGINAFGKKNYLGVFTPPWAVINDERFLETLSDRDWAGGFSEAVKVACIKDRAFFDHLVSSAAAVRARHMRVAMPIIQKSAQIHLRHITEGAPGVAPDPFEMTTARPLDFGHWSAHKLEQMTNFRVRHGEAVAIGIALDVTYCSLIGMISKDDAATIRRCLRNLGLPTYDDALEHSDVLLRGLAEFREHLGGQLTITLVDRIGHGVDVHEMNDDAIRAAIKVLREESGREQSAHDATTATKRPRA